MKSGRSATTAVHNSVHITSEDIVVLGCEVVCAFEIDLIEAIGALPVEEDVGLVEVEVGARMHLILLQTRLVLLLVHQVDHLHVALVEDVLSVLQLLQVLRHKPINFLRGLVVHEQ